jgi:hypothetical protein
MATLAGPVAALGQFGGRLRTHIASELLKLVGRKRFELLTPRPQADPVRVVWRG